MRKVKQLGQGMTEYIIIVALVAIAGITIFSLFGGTLQGAVSDVSQELAGQSAGTAAASEAAKTAAEASTLENMDSYKGQNQ